MLPSIVIGAFLSIKGHAFGMLVLLAVAGRIDKPKMIWASGGVMQRLFCGDVQLATVFRDCEEPGVSSG